MGMGSGGFAAKGGGSNAGNQVYWDSSKGQYYTMKGPDLNSPQGILGAILGRTNNSIDNRNYLGTSLNASGDFQGSTAEPQVYNSSYQGYPQPTTNNGSNVSGGAFDNGVNSDSGIAAILAGLYNSGVFNQQQLNPYAPNGTVGSWTGIPYGQQQESMFSRPRNPYGGQYGQNWNPYGQYYTASNTSSGGGNTNNNIAPPPNTTGPDALSQLNFMMQNNQNQNTQI